MENLETSPEELLHTELKSVLSAKARHKTLKEFNATSWTYPRNETLVSLFRKQAQLSPDAIAVRYLNNQLTYRELDHKSNQIARYLVASGIKPGMLIPVWLDRSVEWLISIIGIIKTGAAYVPIDSAYPVKRASYIIADTQSTIIITDKLLGAQLDHHTRCLFIEQFPDIYQLASQETGHQPQPHDLAYVIYTSGSTGKPKGVMVTHHSIQHLVIWHNQQFSVTRSSKCSLVAGLAFDISVWETWSSLLSGATLYIADNEERTDVVALADYYLKNEITHGFSPSVLTPALVDRTRKLSGLKLRYLFTGGEQLKAVLTSGLPYDLVDYYGPTECTVFATYKIVKDQNGQFLSSIGKPIANTQAYILSPQMEVLPIGAVGELCIGGAALAKGYFNNEELTLKKFVANPFQPGEYLYLTGDLARWLPDGNIQFLGRMDNQVKIRGFRVELGEIERTLINLPEIKNAVVLTKDNIGNNKYLIAFLTLEEEKKKLDTAAIRQQLKQELPGYMIPAQFLILEEIPLTANGKTNRSLLSELAQKYTQETLASEPPTNEVEQLIADIWSSVLERPAINISDNFFDIGGDSLLVAVVIAEIRKKLSQKVYMRDIYQYPVLQNLASVLIDRGEESATAPIEDVEPYVELTNDVYLSPGTVFAGSFRPETLENPKALLLTGATGFVGIHLLYELLNTSAADIYCLVRAQDEFHAMEKINDCFAEFNVSINEIHKPRIIPVVGDLSKPNLGLTPQQFDMLSHAIDIIYHSGSSVNFIEPYSYMKAPNVEGLREIIRLAGAGRTKCLSLLSTISVYSWGHVFTNKTVMTESDDIAQNLLAVSKDIGYVRSKWVMEAIADLAAKEGLPVITYRLGYAMCHSESGASAPYQWWTGLVKNCFEFKSYPALTELREGLITVDYMTKAIAHISRNKEAIGKKFNLIAKPETNLTLEGFFGLLNKYYSAGLKALPYKTWRKQWEDDNKNHLFPLTSLFKDNMHEGLSTVELYQHTYIWDRENVAHFLKGSGIEEPVFDKALLDKYLHNLGIPIK